MRGSEGALMAGCGVRVPVTVFTGGQLLGKPDGDPRWGPWGHREF
jgi:hypothetical protein